MNKRLNHRIRLFSISVLLLLFKFLAIVHYELAHQLAEVLLMYSWQLFFFIPVFIAIHRLSQSQWISDLEEVRPIQKAPLKWIIPMGIALFLTKVLFFGLRTNEVIIGLISVLFWISWYRLSKPLEKSDSLLWPSLLLSSLMIGLIPLTDFAFVDEIHEYNNTLLPWFTFSGLLLGGNSLLLSYYLLFDKKKDIQNHPIRKYFPVFILIWAYLWYVQYFSAWYGNLPAESGLYLNWITEVPPILILITLLTFIIPFFLQLISSQPFVLIIATYAVLLGLLLEKFIWVLNFKPGASEWIIMILISLVFIVFMFNQMVPVKDE